MAEGLGVLDLTQELLPGPLLGGPARQHHLERYLVAGQLVAGEVDGAHAAFAQFAEDLVIVDSQQVLVAVLGHLQ